jgi:endo-1,4-beta-mannosidase
MPEGEPFILGVNYLPRRSMLSWWQRFDIGEVREDFALLHDLGVTKARLFLLWHDFQPSPDAVSSTALHLLCRVADLAAEHGIGLDLTFFVGHASGPNWPPRWLVGEPPVDSGRPMVVGGRLDWSRYHNPFTDPTVLEAARLLVTAIVRRLRDHPGVWMWNLGNEPDLFASPPDHETAREWVRNMVEILHELDPIHPVTCGLHMDSLQRDNGFRVDDVFNQTDVAVMHTYPMYTTWARSPLDPDLPAFSCALVEALCGKPVLLEEWGGCTAAPGEASHVWEWIGYGGTPMRQFMASEEDMAQYVEAVLPRMVNVGATGAMLWCFADAAQELWSQPPYVDWRHERFFGLVRPDGSLKPHADVIRRFAATRPCVSRSPAIRIGPIDADAYYRDPTGMLMALYDGFRAESFPVP